MRATTLIRMARTSPKFGGLMVASLAGVVGLKYLLGGALVFVEMDVVSSVLVTDNLALTFAVGLTLALVTAALGSAFILARAISIAVFLGVMTLSIPAIMAGDFVIITETVGMVLSVVYLLARNPIDRTEPAHIDESESGTRHGSTLR